MRIHSCSLCKEWGEINPTSETHHWLYYTAFKHYCLILGKGSSAANTKAFRKKTYWWLGKAYLHIKSSGNLHVYIVNYFKIIKVCLHQTTAKHNCYNEQHILRGVHKSSKLYLILKILNWCVLLQIKWTAAIPQHTYISDLITCFQL